MNEIVVSIESVSKKYCKSLKSSMLYGLSDISRNILGLSARSERLRKGEFWAVDDVSFELKRGETLGIIGPNGSGKTTTLKMLNGIFWPDKGKITIKGKVGALIEVGAGFHPMLTGRENIYINGAILGMNKKEIDKKFDSIVDFADIGDFLDTPVKNYSSGMYVRLGFAVAIHSDPDLLLIDEILAVGDGTFRHKCYRKMDEIKKKKTAAIIFVSHNLLMAERICDSGLFLYQGRIKSSGDIRNVVQEYQKLIAESMEKQKKNSLALGGMPHCSGELKILDVQYLSRSGKEPVGFSTGESWGVRIAYETGKGIVNPVVQISLVSMEGVHIATFGTHFDSVEVGRLEKTGTIECWMDRLPLLFNTYYVTVGIYESTRTVLIDYWNGAFVNKYFRVIPNKVSSIMSEYTALCHFESRWLIDGRTPVIKGG